MPKEQNSPFAMKHIKDKKEKLIYFILELVQNTND